MKTSQYTFASEIRKALTKEPLYKVKKSLLFRDKKQYKLLIKEVKLNNWTLSEDKKYYYVAA
jgi:hypothetical protein